MLVATHLVPSLAVTAMAVLLAARGAAHQSPAAAGLPAATLPLVALTVLAGQFSVGWSNDAIDAPMDAAVGRRDKPAATGLISARTLWLAAFVALLASLAASAALGPVALLINAVMTAVAWGYNLGLKATPFSALPYLVSFGLLTAFVADALPGHPLPRWQVAVAAGLLGAGAHFANVLPDLAADRASGVTGLPHWLAARYDQQRGQVAVRAVALVLLLAASMLLMLAAGPHRRWVAVGGFGLALLLGAVAARGTGRLPFLAAIGIAGVNAVMLVADGEALTGQP
jgi:4-hydroxybenzoate polyprenyltransferase